jgi:hypothetical protein
MGVLLTLPKLKLCTDPDPGEVASRELLTTFQIRWYPPRHIKPASQVGGQVPERNQQHNNAAHSKNRRYTNKC